MKKFINLNENDIRNIVLNTVSLYLRENKGGGSLLSDFEKYLEKWIKNGYIEPIDVLKLLNNNIGIYSKKESVLIRNLYRAIEGNKTREQQYRAPQIRKLILNELDNLIFFDKSGNEINIRQIFNRTSPKKNTVSYVYDRFPNRDEFVKQQRGERIKNKRSNLNEDEERYGLDGVPKKYQLLLGDLIFEKVSRIETKDGKEVYLYRDGQKPWFIHIISEDMYEELSVDEQNLYKKITTKNSVYKNWYKEHFFVTQYKDMNVLPDVDYINMAEDCISIFVGILQNDMNKNKELLNILSNSEDINNALKNFNTIFVKLSTNKFRNKSGMNFFRNEKDVNGVQIGDNTSYSNNENYEFIDICEYMVNNSNVDSEYCLWYIIQTLYEKDERFKQELNDTEHKHRFLADNICRWILNTMGNVYKKLPENNRLTKGINQIFNNININDGDKLTSINENQLSNEILNILLNSIENLNK